MNKAIGYLGVPSAAGAHSPGIEKAPAALRAAGLTEQLRLGGAPVHDHGDLATVHFAIDAQHRRAQNAAAVGEVARQVDGVVQDMLTRDELPFVMGGDCTILAGVLSALVRRDADPGLVYFDAHPDLNTPTAVVQGALDWMGMAHILGLPDTVAELRDVGPRSPLLAQDAVVFFSYVPSEMTAWEESFFRERRPAGVPAEEVAADPAGAAQRAADIVRTRRDRLVVHFDVDALDFVDCPIADNAYQRNQGLTLEQALTALEQFVARPEFAALVVTQVNPDHAAAQAGLLDSFATRLAAVMTRRPLRRP
jgi:arginase